MDAQQLAQAMAQAIQQALQQQGQDQQQALQQIVQQLQPAAPTAAAFARAPALANQGILDYNNKNNSYIFKEATKALPTIFKLNEPNVHVLLDELKTRAQTFGWDRVLTVDVQGTPINVLDGHGRMTIQHCQAHADTYVNANQHDAQNDYQLLCCLKGSMDEETTQMMSLETHLYVHPGATPNDPQNQSGLCYLKALLNKAEADTRSMAALIRMDLATLPVYMVDTAQYDIKTFNQYVRKLVSQLQSRGEQSTDTLFNLFRAYETVKDETFRTYIQREKDDYQDGRHDLTIIELMTKAEQKYKTMLLEKTWFKPSAEQEEIIALKAQMEHWKTKKTPKTAPAKTTDDPTKRKKLKKDSTGKPIFEGKEKWKNKAPAPGQPTTKTVKGKTFHYCAKHGYWCIHSTNECRLTSGEQPEAEAITAAMADVGIEDLELDDQSNE